MCLISQREEPCNHPECQGHFNSFMVDSTKAQLMESLVMLLLSRNAALLNLSNITGQIDKRAAELEMQKTHQPSSKEPKKMSFYTKEDYDLKIIIIGETPNMVLKEKGFCIQAEVRDKEDNKLFIDKLFKVRLFTNENEPKSLKLNIASKKILRGTLEARMSEDLTIMFDNIVINEVSSHYINESFTIVVSCDDPETKPLVIENLYVRARNSNKKK